MTSFLIIIAFSIVLVAFGVAMLYFVNKKKSQAWQQFAKLNNLNLKINLLKTEVDGLYRGHHFRVDTIMDHKEQYTRLTLWPDEELSKAQELANDDISTKKINSYIKKTLALKNKKAFNGSFLAQANANPLIYLAPGILTDVAHLEKSSNILVKLAEGYKSIVNLGGEAISPLRSIAKQNNHPLQGIAQQLITDISVSSEQQFINYDGLLVCPNCLTRYDLRPIAATDLFDTKNYYGCRSCGQSRVFINNPIVAVLDTEMLELTEIVQDTCRINTFKRGKLFDFDEVEIIQATDEQVERFMVQLGNDTDSFRKPLYQNATCFISPQCNLLPTTIRILEKTFKNIEHHRT